MELRTVLPRKTADPDVVCPRKMKVCANQLAKPLKWLLSLSLQVERFPVVGKNIMSCASSQGCVPGRLWR